MVEHYEQKTKLLLSRFASARTIAGTHKLHSFRSISSELVEVREFSTSPEQRVERISLSTVPVIEPVIMKGYVTARYDGQWWLACVMQTYPDSAEVSFLHPNGSAQSFKYPSPSDVLVMSCQDILSAVNQATLTGRVYTLLHEEMLAETILDDMI